MNYSRQQFNLPINSADICKLNIRTPRNIDDIAWPVARLITTAQLSVILGTSQRSVERWAAKGEIPGRCKIGSKTIRYDAEVIADWIKHKCMPITRYNANKTA